MEILSHFCSCSHSEPAAEVGAFLARTYLKMESNNDHVAAMGNGKPTSKKGRLLQTSSYDSCPKQQEGNHNIHLPGCCRHVPPVLLRLMEHKVSIVGFPCCMSESMNGVWAPYMLSLSFWDLGICSATGKLCVFADRSKTNPLQM